MQVERLSIGRYAVRWGEPGPDRDAGDVTALVVWRGGVPRCLRCRVSGKDASTCRHLRAAVVQWARDTQGPR